MARHTVPLDALEEGSGHDITNPFYDEEDTSLYDGNDSYDGGGSYWNYDEEDLGVPEVTMKCFRCIGNDTGCDVVDMLNRPDLYTTTCHGRCLNVSSGMSAVYDCARDLTVSQDECFIRGDLRLCFCSGDLCNQPHPAMTLLHLFKPFLTTNTPPPKIPTNLTNFTPSSLDLTNLSSVIVPSNSSDVTNNRSDIPFSDGFRTGNVDLSSNERKGDDFRLPKFMAEEIDVVIPRGGSASSATEGNASSLTSGGEGDSNPRETIKSLNVGSSKESSSPSLYNSRIALSLSCCSFLASSFVLIYSLAYVRFWL